MTNYWETFKKQASHDYMKTNHEMLLDIPKQRI